ncbi:MAG: hypothetical protein ACLQF0_01050 [Dissulfurispiraceae bacterium]
MGTFWNVSSIKGTTINFIDTPVIGTASFLIPLYIFLFAIAAVMFLMMSRNHLQVKRHAVVRALLLAFVTAAVLFAARMDYGWYKMWQLDSKNPQGSLDESIAMDLRTVNSFVEAFKKAVPLSEKVAIITDDSYDRMVLKYYLLPIRISEDANDIIVFSNRHVVFDTGRNALLEDGNVVENNVSLVASYEGKFFIFRKKDKDKNRTED